MPSSFTVWMVAACFVAAPSAQEQLDRYEFFQIRMGVPFRIVLYAPDEASANTAAAAAYRRLKQLDRIFSDYDPDSELSRLCRLSAPGRPVNVSREMEFVLSKSLALSRQSEGAFDVTIGPVVKLWRKARRRKNLPDSQQLASARKRVGYQSLRLDRRTLTLELCKDEMRLDFGGIAKGYACDQALLLMRRYGIRRALVDGGGDVAVGDPPPNRPGWRIGIAPLGSSKKKPARFLLLKNAAVATSGDAYHALTIDGVRYSHIVNPHTGLGLTQSSSVTVVAPDGITADGLASAVSVLGPERGLKLVDGSKNTAALIVKFRRGEPVRYESEGFNALFEDK